jgi:regulator of protease activity HflC (stomatin/prohibitin superfamily)
MSKNQLDSDIEEALSVYDTDAPQTKDKAEELLKKYYKEHRGEKDFPRRYNLMSWKLNQDSSMVVVDGASGRKLTFEGADKPGSFKYIEDAVDAEMTAEDAEADAEEAEGKAAQARALAEQLKTNANLKAKAAKKEKAEVKVEPKVEPKNK